MTKAKKAGPDAVAVAAAKQTIFDTFDALAIVRSFLTDDLEGDLTPEAEELLDKAVGDVRQKLRAYAALVIQHEEHVAVLDGYKTFPATRVKVLAAAAKADQEKADWKRARIIDGMMRLGVTELEFPECSLRVIPYGQPAVEITRTLPEPALVGRDALAEELDGSALVGCIEHIEAYTIPERVIPAQHVPAHRRWNEEALIDLHNSGKEGAALVATVANVTRTYRVRIQ